jgi:citronellol/citronellal dehydrogenase
MTAHPFGLSDSELHTLPCAYRDDLLAGITVVVSGGASGIGKATAWLCGRLGAEVVLVSRDAAKLDAARAAMAAAGLRVVAYPLNIRDPDQVRDTLATITAEVGNFTVLINSAGGQFPKPALDITDNGWRAVVDTNLNGTWYMMQAAARLWRDRGRGGAIVNLVAVVDRGMVDMAHSCAARAGVIHLSKTLAVEWAPLGIRVNCVAPGVIASEGMTVYSDTARAAFPGSNPMMRFGSPWEVAQAVVYLASPAAAFITGDTLTIDGGGRLWGELWPHAKPDYFKSL